MWEYSMGLKIEQVVASRMLIRRSPVKAAFNAVNELSKEKETLSPSKINTIK